MDTTQPGRDLIAALQSLLDKYAIDAPRRWRLVEGEQRPDGDTGEGLTLVPGWLLPEAELAEDIVPLLPWRSERRFVELKRMVDDRTIEPVLMCRFACLTNGDAMSLGAVLYREFDLAEWLGGAPIVSVYTALNQRRCANAIARLANNVLCSVEAGVTLPAGSATIDRHELIARRGVASDRTVDTQVPQSSVYAFTAVGPRQYTDTDAELFGLRAEAASLVRSGYEVLARSDRAATLRQRRRRLVELVELAFQSDRKRQRLVVEGRLPCNL